MRTIIVNTLMFVLIIVWGAYVQSSNTNKVEGNLSIEIGGIFFFLFSIFYLFSLYLLYKLRSLGKKLFVPLVVIFIILGFLSELFNPMQFSIDIFYLLIFYIVSPIFFICQGVLISIIYLSDFKNKFY